MTQMMSKSLIREDQRMMSKDVHIIANYVQKATYHTQLYILITSKSITHAIHQAEEEEDQKRKQEK